jgi:hypothetical protein
MFCGALSDSIFKQPSLSLSSCPHLLRASRLGTQCPDYRDGRNKSGHDERYRFNFQTAKRQRPVLLSGDGCACRRIPRGPGGVVPRKMVEGAERRQAHQQCHACEARRASCDQRARLSALHRGDFGRRDSSITTPDRPCGRLIPRAFAGVRPGAICQLWRALVVGLGSTPRLPEMACETIRRRRPAPPIKTPLDDAPG